MKFKYIGPPVLDRDGNSKVRVYTGLVVEPGETFELEGHFAEKAQRNPMLRQVKPGRPRKADAVNEG